MSCILCTLLILMASLWLAQALVKIGPLRSASHFPTAFDQTWLGAMTLGPPPFRPRDASTRRDLTMLRWTLYRICLKYLGKGPQSRNAVLLCRSPMTSTTPKSLEPGGVRHGGHQFSGFHGGHLGGGRRDPGRREEDHLQVVGSGFGCGLGMVQGIGAGRSNW